MFRASIALVALLALGGCREDPRRIENDNLGIAATFPGPAKLHRHTEPGPFGEVEWFDLAMNPAGRLDETFSVSVGNLPPGDRGGTTPREILTTFQNFLIYRFGLLRRTELPADRGPGFRYKVKGMNGGFVEGIAVLRSGRLYHAQAIVRREDDPRTLAFLDDFEVRGR
ncbi:hypothetical protein [Geothrix sp. 21YS21S-4]|uniref:hypothetical protein n=1 Tax=Geothrix sp. 21YS21S-4 TaxID=3068889 RepID=UPI0027B9D8B5|nr:hypothetical protein [Geothrix sp. 21YS21S-4]